MTSTTDLEPNLDPTTSILPFFSSHPTLQRGLQLLNIAHPTYLQSSLFSSLSSASHLTLIAPEKSGKLLGVLLHSLRRILSSTTTSSLLLILTPSKESSLKCATLLNQLARIESLNLWLTPLSPTTTNTDLPSASVIISSPAQAQSLPKLTKDTITHTIILDFDMLIWTGYSPHLHRLFSSFPATPSISLTATSSPPELLHFKQTYMKKVLNIEIQDPLLLAPTPKQQGTTISHFFYVGETYGIYSALYITLKFGMVHPKTLILCKDLREVYKTYLFLERCSIRNIGLYNHENPVDVKFYSLSLWLRGHTNILIATEPLFTDISSQIFRSNCIRMYKKPTIELRSLSSIIALNISHLSSFAPLFSHFPNKSLLITLTTPSELPNLNELFTYQKQNFSHVKLKNFPITNLEVESFVYRTKDLLNHLSGKRVSWAMEIDLKKKLVKSKDLHEYFQAKPQQKQLLLKQISELTGKLNYGRVELTGEVPPYLVPEVLKEGYKRKVEEELKEDWRKPVESIGQKIRKVVGGIEEGEEDPEVVDVGRLKIISNRKRWKMKHGFKLRRRNIKNQKRGIFQ